MAEHNDQPPTEPAEPLWIALVPAQVEHVLRQQASKRGPGSGLLALLLALMGGGEKLDIHDLERDPRYHDHRISQTMLCGLPVLSAFASGEEQKITVVARELGMSPGTTHRYANTWLEFGVLERHQKTRHYQLAAQLRNDGRQFAGTSGPAQQRALR
jgi:IclR helix-turn-helix domain